MSDAATDVVELLVGLACLAASLGVRRRPGMTVLALVLGVAGAAAIGHAAWSALGN